MEITGYQCLKKNRFILPEGYAIAPVQPDEIERIRVMRNQQIEHLRQMKPIDAEEQKRYFQDQIWPSLQDKHPRQILFSMYEGNDWIGYGGIVHINWEKGSGEVSFISDRTNSAFPHFLTLIKQVAFDELHFQQLTAETYAFRKEVREQLEEAGFRLQTILRDHVYKRDRWQDSWIHRLKRTPDEQKMGVLITSLSKKVPLAHAVRAGALRAYGDVLIHGADTNPACLGRYFVDDFWHCPPLEELTVEQMVDYCKRYRIQAIIPTRDADLTFYAAIKRHLENAGIHVLVSDSDVIAVCLDKLAFAQKLPSHAIPTSSLLDDIHSDRYVVKEQKGAGSISIGVNLSKEEALKHSLQLKNPLFQPFIQGKEWSVDVYRTKQGVVHGVVARFRNLVVQGESQVTTTKHHPALEALCASIADTLNLYGPAVMQLIEDETGAFHLIECNARFGGASTASVGAGLESFYWFFSECLGKSLDPFKRNPHPIRQIRFPADRSLPCASSYSI
jgi:RimJ/RimL family protein N-acetyltransferase